MIYLRDPKERRLMILMPHLLAAMAVSLGLVGAANAQVAARPLDLRLPDRDAAIAPISLGGLGFEAARPTPDLAKTAIEHHFAQRDDLKGSLGFLCGLQPGHGDTGVASAYGSDPHGRFVGAKFSIAFQ
jgi:hypothetical protein